MKEPRITKGMPAAVNVRVLERATPALAARDNLERQERQQRLARARDRSVSSEASTTDQPNPPR